MTILQAGFVDSRFASAPPARLNPGGRIVAGLLAAACLAVLIIATRLTPRPDGLGTHRALGLPQCAWLVRTGLPCPACGMTTSFAWFVRGNLAASMYVQPMGTALAFICALCVWAGGYIAATGQPLHWLISAAPPRYHVVPLLALAIAAWAWKIFIHLHGIDGWR